MRTRSLAPLAIAAALVLSSCSGDGGSSSSDTAVTTTAAATTVAVTTAAPGTTVGVVTSAGAGTTAASGDQALADSMLLTVEDLTPGWAAVTGQDDGEASPLEACYPEGGALAKDPLAEAKSDDLVLNDTTVSQRAAVEADEATVQAQLAEMTAPTMQECLRSTMESELGKQMPPGVEVSGVTISTLDGVNVDNGFAYLVKVTLKADDKEQDVALAYVGAGAGRLHTSVTVAFTTSEVDEDLVAEIWSAAEAKLQAAAS